MAKDSDDNEVQVIKIKAEDIALQLTRIEKIVFAAPAARQSEAVNTNQAEPQY